MVGRKLSKTFETADCVQVPQRAEVQLGGFFSNVLICYSQFVRGEIRLALDLVESVDEFVTERFEDFASRDPFSEGGSISLDFEVTGWFHFI
ncbi:hypothetical protein R1sor_007080 [Riccia sorocarpa]|uniref:Uncharacterized protein n=1 Tax=Riccia sorocarpa TaxID=122646 RepID=A0ABD3HS77_9MARC